MSEAVIDVVVPLFESAETVGATLLSLQNQTFKDWRAIVVNDGSTDAGPSLARELAASDGRIVVIDQTNGGLARARNRGLEEASARYVLFLDADDVLESGGLASLLAAAERSPVGSSFGGYRFLDAAGAPIGRESVSRAAQIGLDELLSYNPFVPCAPLTRREAIGEMRFDPKRTVAEDYDFWLRLAGRGVRWSSCGDIVAGYRVRPDSMSKDFATMARTADAVLADGFAIARSLPLSDVDAGADRERSSRESQALGYATRLALFDSDPSQTDAKALLAELSGDRLWSTEDLATATVFGVQYGLGQAPEPTSAAAIWTPRFAAWAAALGLDPQAAIAAFAERAVHPVRVSADERAGVVASYAEAFEIYAASRRPAVTVSRSLTNCTRRSTKVA